MEPRRAALAVAVAVVLAGVVVGGILGGRLGRPGVHEGTGPGRPPSTAAAQDQVGLKVASFDGTELVFDVHRPAGADATHPVPLVLLAHGVTANRSTPILVRLSEALVAQGFGVLAPDLRGHGESGGTSRLSDPTQDVRDFTVLLDWAYDHLDWVVHQEGTGHAKDLLVGGWGFSLGGAMVQITAALDGRLDAIVPQNTMNDYTAIIAPGGAVKSFWVNVFIALSKTPPGTPEGTWRADPVFEQIYVDTMAQNALPPAGRDLLHKISPATYLDRLAAPALYVEGVTDMAFPLDEALRNREALARHGPTPPVFTWLGGHKTPYQPYDESTPCGDYVPVVTAFFVQHLKGGADPRSPSLAVAMDDGSCLHLDAMPTTYRNTTLGAAALPAYAGSLLLPVFTAGDAVRIVGDPVLTGSATVANPDDILYASLVVLKPDGSMHVLDFQVTPLRLPGPATAAVHLGMDAVGAVLRRGDHLLLKLDRENEWFATNGGRTPGAIAFTDLSLALPVAP